MGGDGGEDDMRYESGEEEEGKDALIFITTALFAMFSYM